ncbi:zinc knuckle CX2CX4HX4C containing protein, partial [Tanacetum coccineum]
MIDDTGEEDINSLLNSFNATIKNMEGWISHNSDLNMVHESTRVTKTVSFSNVLMAEKTQSQPKVNFRKMNVTSSLNGDYGAMIPMSSVLEFSSKKGVEDVLENGPWMIRTVPIILNKWTPSSSLTKENQTRVPVSVKLHDVPLAAFTADGLSVIASKVGNPVMLDSYTCTMCNESWRRSSYTREMIEIDADVELKETVTVVVPNLECEGYTCEKVMIEYEWRPPHCLTCKTCCHSTEMCPISVKEPLVKAVEVQDEGFQVVNGRNKGKKQTEKPFPVRTKTNLAY